MSSRASSWSCTVTGHAPIPSAQAARTMFCAARPRSPATEGGAPAALPEALQRGAFGDQDEAPALAVLRRASVPPGIDDRDQLLWLDPSIGVGPDDAPPPDRLEGIHRPQG